MHHQYETCVSLCCRVTAPLPVFQLTAGRSGDCAEQGAGSAKAEIMLYSKCETLWKQCLWISNRTRTQLR